MTEPNEPKKETTRISVAPEVAEKPPEPNTKSRDTVRIQLPLREPPVHILTEPQPAVQEGGSPQFFQAATTSTGAVKRRGHACTRSAVVGADQRDSSHSPSHGSDEKDSTACHHARGGTAVSFNRYGCRGEKSNADVVAAAWCFCRDFDYSDLDLSFLNLWIIPLLLSSMNPILTVK